MGLHGSGGGGGGDNCVCVCVWEGGGGAEVGTSMEYARHASRNIVMYRSGFDSSLVI